MTLGRYEDRWEIPRRLRRGDLVSAGPEGWVTVITARDGVRVTHVLFDLGVGGETTSVDLPRAMAIPIRRDLLIPRTIS